MSFDVEEWSKEIFQNDFRNEIAMMGYENPEGDLETSDHMTVTYDLTDTTATDHTYIALIERINETSSEDSQYQEFLVGLGFEPRS